MLIQDKFNRMVDGWYGGNGGDGGSKDPGGFRDDEGGGGGFRGGLSRFPQTFHRRLTALKNHFTPLFPLKVFEFISLNLH